MGTVSEIQHRQKITIWVEDKNNFDYYLAEESFLNCFTNICVEYKCLSYELSCDIKHFDELANNIFLMPVYKEENWDKKIKEIADETISFIINFNVPIIIGAGHLDLKNTSLNTPIPVKYCKIFCNNTTSEDERLIGTNNYPIKLFNYHGNNKSKFDVFKTYKHDSIIDEREWWDTKEMLNSYFTKITNKNNIWKALMLGQPFSFDHDYDLEKMGFKLYPWANKKIDKLFIKKNSYFINKHNRENFYKMVENNNNYAIFAKEVFTF